MADLGHTGVPGSTEGGLVNYTVWGRIGTAPSNGTITSASSYCINAVVINLKLAIYAENGTADGPGTLIWAQTTGQPSPGTVGFFTDNSATGNIVSGTTYWMGWRTDSAAMNFVYDTDAAYKGLYETPIAFGDAWASPGTFTTSSTRRWGFYLTYTATSGEVLAWSPVVRAVRGANFAAVTSGFTPPSDPE